MSTRPIHELLPLLTVKQCAESLQCSVTQVERFIRRGELKRVSLASREPGPGQRGPKAWRVTPRALAEFVGAREGREQARVREGEPAARRPAVMLPMATGTDGKTRARLPKPK